jgi:hypothetical protein
MLGFTDEYTVVPLFPTTKVTSAAVTATSTVSASCIDVRPFTGKGLLGFFGGSALSAVAPIGYSIIVETCNAASFATTASADVDGGTWSAMTAFTAVTGATSCTSQWVSIDWDAVSGKFMRIRVVNNETLNSFTATGIAIGRKQDA